MEAVGRTVSHIRYVHGRQTSGYARINRAGPGRCQSSCCFSLSPLSRLAHSQYSPIELETAYLSTRDHVGMHEVKSEQLQANCQVDNTARNYPPWSIPRDAQRADAAEETGHFLLASAKLTGMIQQHIFASQDVPERFECQIFSFVRIQWPELFSGKNRLRDWTSKPELHPVTVLREEEGVLISRLEIVWDVLTHVGETYLTSGLSGVFTYPAFRKQGYGLQLVQSAKAFIEQQAEADLVLFHSTLKGFYEQAGF